MLNWFSNRFHFRYRKVYFYKYIDRIIFWRSIFYFLIISKIPTKWIKIAVVLRNFKVNNTLSEEKHASRYFTLFRWLSLLNFRKTLTSYRTSGFVLAHGATIRRLTCLDVVRISLRMFPNTPGRINLEKLNFTGKLTELAQNWFSMLE